jgi:hypothetical protein
MKLKPTVALSILGLAGGLMFANQALAAAGDSGNARMASLKSFLDTNQGQVRSFAEKSSDWFNRLSISVMANADYTSSNYTVTENLGVPSIAGADENSNDLVLSNLNVFVDYDVSSMVNAHVGFNWFQNQIGYKVYQPHNVAPNTFGVDEAYVTLGDLSASPVYARVGKQYVDFGTYKRFPKTATLTQLLAQTQATAVTVGMIHGSGLQVSGYLFNGTDKSTDANGRQHVNNGGLHVGYRTAVNGVTMNLAADYMNNFDSDYVRNVTGLADGSGYVDRTGAYSLHADVAVNGVDLGVDYVAASSDFNAADLQHASVSAKPSAFAVNAGYSFAMMGDYNSRVGVSYQRSKEASEMTGSDIGVAGVGQDNLPKSRTTVDYDVEIGKMTTIGLQYRRDKEYNIAGADNGKKINTGIVRLGVNFA